MKIRTGFVSNSSSSSFTVCVPKGSTEAEIRTIIERLVGKMEGFFLPEFRQQLIDTIMECKGELIDLEKDLQFENKWLADTPESSTEERDQLQKQIDSGNDYYQGGFSDNGNGPIQFMLRYTNFKVEEDNFLMENYAE